MVWPTKIDSAKAILCRISVFKTAMPQVAATSRAWAPRRVLAIRREINRRLFIFGLAVLASPIKSADAVADQRSKGEG